METTASSDVCEVGDSEAVELESKTDVIAVSGDAGSATTDNCCESDDSVVEMDTPAPCNTHARISMLSCSSSNQSLPFLLMPIPTLPMQSASSSAFSDASLHTLPSRTSSLSEITVSGISVVADEDVGISARTESRVSLDSDTSGIVNVTFDPFCRICQLSGCECQTAGDDRLISPCRCSGSLQYTHTACLVVS